MNIAAFLISISVAVLMTSFLTFFLLLPWAKASEDKALARRIADARMNARLLRLNL